MIFSVYSCSKDEIKNHTLIPLQSRSTPILNVKINADTLDEKLEIILNNEKSILITHVANGLYLISGDSPLHKIKLSLTPVKSLSLYDANNNLSEKYFDDDDDVIEERPCCSRNEFKAWYKAFSDNCTGTPECDVICAMVPVCEIAHYASALMACCYFGYGPSFVGAEIALDYSFTFNDF